MSWGVLEQWNVTTCHVMSWCHVMMSCQDVILCHSTLGPWKGHELEHLLACTFNTSKISGDRVICHRGISKIQGSRIQSNFLIVYSIIVQSLCENVPTIGPQNVWHQCFKFFWKQIIFKENSINDTSFGNGWCSKNMASIMVLMEIYCFCWSFHSRWLLRAAVPCWQILAVVRMFHNVGWQILWDVFNQLGSWARRKQYLEVQSRELVSLKWKATPLVLGRSALTKNWQVFQDQLSM